MARLESGALALKCDWIDVGELISSAVARAAKQLENLHVRPLIEPGLPLLQADFVLMEQVLFNILDNAAKHSPPFSDRVTIAARREGDSVAVTISDEGAAFRRRILERVFDKFYRVRAGDKQIAGTGLGLSICRGIVEAHGGTIGAHSPVAEGTAPASRCACPSPISRERICHERQAAPRAGHRRRAADPPVPAHRASSANDYEVIEAETGAEALRRASTDRPDVIVLDLGLPDIEGIELLRRIREWSQAAGHRADRARARGRQDRGAGPGRR